MFLGFTRRTVNRVRVLGLLTVLNKYRNNSSIIRQPCTDHQKKILFINIK